MSDTCHRQLPQTLSGMRVALVHDWLTGCGGGERVLHDLHRLFPHAPIYTLVHDRRRAPAWTLECDVRTTSLQRLPGTRSHHRLLLPLMSRAWESVDLMEYDLVISTCSSCCKGVLTRPDATHVCYCLSPTRYLWDLYYDYARGAGPLKRAAMPAVTHGLRLWDYLAAQRVDHFIADSDFVGTRIAKYYHRDSVTIYPGTTPNPNPVTETPDDYYLIVARFVRYKRVDIAIEACNMLGRRLVVVGSGGEEERRLKRLCGPTVSFLGRLSDEEVGRLYSRARAFLFPGVEDYGITPVEAASAGVPTLALGAGGALETVIDHETGLLFHDQSAQGLAACMERFEREGVARTRHQIREHSLRFSDEVFYERMVGFLERCVSHACQGHRSTGHGGVEASVGRKDGSRQ